MPMDPSMLALALLALLPGAAEESGAAACANDLAGHTYANALNALLDGMAQGVWGANAGIAMASAFPGNPDAPGFAAAAQAFGQAHAHGSAFLAQRAAENQRDAASGFAQCNGL